MELNIQEFLAERFAEQREYFKERFAEQREDFKELNEKVEQFHAELTVHAAQDLTALAAVHTRLTVVESLHKNLKWFGRTAIGAALTFVGDLVFNHVPHWLGKR